MARSQAEVEQRRPIVTNGAVGTHLPATVKTLAGSAYTFSTTITIPYRGCTLTFCAGTAYELDAPLLAFLSANSITPTAL